MAPTVPEIMNLFCTLIEVIAEDVVVMATDGASAAVTSPLATEDVTALASASEDRFTLTETLAVSPILAATGIVYATVLWAENVSLSVQPWQDPAPLQEQVHL